MTMTAAGEDPEAERLGRRARAFGYVAIGMFVLGWLLVAAAPHSLWWLLVGIAPIQGISGITGAIYAIRRMKRAPGSGGVGQMIVFGLFGLAGLLGIPLFLFVAALASSGFGISGWGRPLRIRGRLVHPEVRAGDEWTLGDAPDVAALDAPTRAALAAWWLQDAKKEHASVPAFSRISWQLAALGAPATLLERCHRAALEEVDHTRRCFALVAGYAGRALGVEPMPELLTDSPGPGGLAKMATDSLVDGCLIEDLNADAAALALSRASEPAVRGVVERIARDERSHAELAWDLLAWCLERGGTTVARAVDEELARLPTRGPVPYGPELGELVAAADPRALIAHGRVPWGDWPGLFATRRALTIARARALLEPIRAAA